MTTFPSRSAPRFACVLVVLAACGTTESPPADAWERPTNAWPASEPPAALLGQGFEVGEVVPDLRLLDQHGDEVALWQFWGNVVLLAVSATWCRPCHDLALTAEQVGAGFDRDEVVVLTVLEEDDGGLEPVVADAVAWVETFGAEGPVLVDPEQVLSPALQGSYPAVLLLNRELVVAARAPDLSAETLHDLIESEL